jgi:hypothetical protein
MRPIRGFVWCCALVLSATALGPVRAEDAVFRECCDRCGPAVAAYPPPCSPCCPAPCRCGPIRRLLRRCFLLPVTICRPSCYTPPVVPCAPACPVPACVPGVVVPPPAPVPTVVPGGVVPVPQAPGSGYERNIPPVPPTPAPPLTGNSSRGENIIAPLPPRTLPPPAMPAPVRLDRFVSEPGQPDRGSVEAVPATRTRPLDR